MNLKAVYAYALVIILALAILAATAYAALYSSKTIVSSGRIVGVNLGVYSNSACTKAASSIDWGSLQPGENRTVTLWIKNAGKTPITLTLATSNWTPTEAAQAIGLSWSRNNSALAANQAISAILTLSVSKAANSIDAFSFNIIITGHNNIHSIR